VPLRVSAKTGEGLEALRRRIAERLAALMAKGSEETGDVTARQASQLELAAQALAGVDVGDPVLAANALRQAAEAIGRIVGKTYSDDLLDELFSRFCVGK
jgi:tRNA modification GTPase